MVVCDIVEGMVYETPTPVRTKCLSCGYETDAESDEWDTANHPTLGTLTQCPGCGSTDTTSILE